MTVVICNGDDRHNNWYKEMLREVVNAQKMALKMIVAMSILVFLYVGSMHN